MTKNSSGRVPDGTGLSSSTEPQSSQGLGPTGFDPSRDWIELRPDEDGNFDEIVARFADGMVHVETMSDNSVYIGFYKGELAQTEGLQFWISSKKRLRYCHDRFRARDSDGPRMAETNEDSARGEAGPARAAESGIAQPLNPKADPS